MFVSDVFKIEFLLGRKIKNKIMSVSTTAVAPTLELDGVECNTL